MRPAGGRCGGERASPTHHCFPRQGLEELLHRCLLPGLVRQLVCHLGLGLRACTCTCVCVCVCVLGGGDAARGWQGVQHTKQPCMGVWVWVVASWGARGTEVGGTLRHTEGPAQLRMLVPIAGSCKVGSTRQVTAPCCSVHGKCEVLHGRTARGCLAWRLTCIGGGGVQDRHAVAHARMHACMHACKHTPADGAGRWRSGNPHQLVPLDVFRRCIHHGPRREELQPDKAAQCAHGVASPAKALDVFQQYDIHLVAARWRFRALARRLGGASPHATSCC